MRSRRSTGEPGLRVGDGLGCGRGLEVLRRDRRGCHLPDSQRTELISRLIRAGVSPGQAELLVAREWAVRAGENERLTGEVGRLAGHQPRAVREFLHDFLSAFA
jgi:hypothetical protein